MVRAHQQARGLSSCRSHSSSPLSAPACPRPPLRARARAHARPATPSRLAAPGEPVLESLRWVAPRAIVGALLGVGGGSGDEEQQREEEDVVYLGVTWRGWDGTAAAAPESLAVSELGVAYMGVRPGVRGAAAWSGGWGGWGGRPRSAPVAAQQGRAPQRRAGYAQTPHAPHQRAPPARPPPCPIARRGVCGLRPRRLALLKSGLRQGVAAGHLQPPQGAGARRPVCRAAALLLAPSV
jgi:hypothetical protein